MNICRGIFYSLPLVGALGGGSYSALVHDSKKEQYTDEIILTSIVTGIALPTLPLWLPIYVFHKISSDFKKTEI